MVRAMDQSATDGDDRERPAAASDGAGGLLKLIRESGDANLGRTLLRLAAAAAAEHRAELARGVAADDTGRPHAPRPEVRR